MKPRSILPLVAILVYPFGSHAQRPSRSGLGYMFGPQAATWHSEAVIYRPVPGFVAGLYSPIRAGNRWEIQPELLLSLQGAARDRPEGDRSTMRNLSAIIPVSLKLFLTPAFNLQAGVQGGYLILANANGTDISDQVSKLDMGLNAGVGIGTRSGIDLTLRYYNGLSNTLAEDHVVYPTNRNLQLTVGRRFMQFSKKRFRR